MKTNRLGINQIIFSFFVISVLTLCTHSSIYAQMTSYEVADMAMESSLIVISLDRHGEPYSYGTGFCCAPGKVATNAHVIEGAHNVLVLLMDNEQEHWATKLVAVDHEHDLAILDVNTLQAQPLEIRTSGRLRLGDNIYALGNPMGLQGTFSAGNVSAFREHQGVTYIQITAPISPGSSGGPVLDDNCQVVGIATAQLSKGQNLNFAIPATYLQRMLRPDEQRYRNYNNFTDKSKNNPQGIKNWFLKNK